MFENKEHEEIMKKKKKMFDFIVKFMFILTIIMMLFILKLEVVKLLFLIFH